ncbi:hypothetical protein [Photobacterium swingsii]|uniref:hypothetical protein n=1 Tax=Photobacterium swingsii TaxID=680026 RepID=UPI000AC63715|nr:hypothetical protein [Photobacterium swingsii]
MSDKIKKNFHLGGSIEKALKGEADLQAVSVLQEAWKITARHFFDFFAGYYRVVFSTSRVADAWPTGAIG